MVGGSVIKLLLAACYTLAALRNSMNTYYFAILPTLETVALWPMVTVDLPKIVVIARSFSALNTV